MKSKTINLLESIQTELNGDVNNNVNDILKKISEKYNLEQIDDSSYKTSGSLGDENIKAMFKNIHNDLVKEYKFNLLHTDRFSGASGSIKATRKMYKLDNSFISLQYQDYFNKSEIYLMLDEE